MIDKQTCRTCKALIILFVFYEFLLRTWPDKTMLYRKLKKIITVVIKKIVS